MKIYAALGIGRDLVKPIEPREEVKASGAASNELHPPLAAAEPVSGKAA